MASRAHSLLRNTGQQLQRLILMDLSSPDARLFFPATQRNRRPIGDVLAETLPPKGLILELASGSGEHGVAFQKRFPQITWQCSDPDRNHCRSISAWISKEGLTTVMPQPLSLDVCSHDWLAHGSEAPVMVVAVNLLHISPWECTRSLMQGSVRHLKPGGKLLIYGPFRVSGKHVSESNQRFDDALQERDPSWGVREQEAVVEEARKAGLALQDIRLMPSNNRIILLER